MKKSIFSGFFQQTYKKFRLFISAFFMSENEGKKRGLLQKL